MNRILALSAMILFLGIKLNSQNPIKRYQDRDEAKTEKNKLVFLFEIENFTGFGKEKVAKNFLKQQFFSGIEGSFAARRKNGAISIFFFANLYYFHEKGIDNSPKGKPYTWNDNKMNGEFGPGLKIEIPFNEREKSGIRLLFKSNIMGYVDQKGILSMEPQVFFKIGFLNLSIGNKLELLRNGILQPVFTLGHEF